MFDDLWQKSKDEQSIFEHCIDNINEEQSLGFIIWWIFLFIDIFNGNVYRKIYNDEAAFDYYCKAMRRFESKDDITGIVDQEFCDKQYPGKQCSISSDLFLKSETFFCKTIVKTRFEKGKIFFSQGQFLGSLKWYLRALMDILLLSCKKDVPPISNNNILSQYCNLQKIIRYLDHDKELLIFNKELLKELIKENLANDLFELKQLIDEKYWELASHLLPRIGFVLYTLRIHKIFGTRPEDIICAEDYINRFFKPEEIFGPKYHDSYGCYCSAITHSGSEHENKSKKKYFTDKPERIFSFSAIENTYFRLQKGDLTSLAALALNLGVTSMINIDNIVTIPKVLNSFLMRRGYKARAKKISGPANKLVILRRWQSFNPIIPRPHGTRFTRAYVPGGGYLLVWQGKGIVIDPGFDFIQNLYDEGFSIEDIDAIIITHAHIDHDNELSSILTLIHEWNTYWQKQGSKDDNLEKKIDLFLNEGSYRKFHSWLYSPTEVVKKIYQLPLNVFNIDKDLRKNKEISNRRGKNIEIDLQNNTKDGYNLTIEVIPAVHYEIIAKNSAIGLKLRLKNGDKPEFILGITGDTFAYGNIEKEYDDCDILIAHLGDIKFREIRSLGDVPFTSDIFLNLFSDLDEKSRIQKLKNFVAALDIVDQDKIEGDDYNTIANNIVDAMNADHNYEYANHLGIKGIHDLHKAMCSNVNNKDKQRLMIIGEHPEELASFRHILARFINLEEHNISGETAEINSADLTNWRVKCLTGDIGLHVEIRNIDNTHNNIFVRCYRCNQNNEMTKDRDRKHYYPIKEIQETIVKQLGNRMVYLCKTCGHAIFPLEEPKYFLNKPYPRYV